VGGVAVVAGVAVAGSVAGAEGRGAVVGGVVDADSAGGAGVVLSVVLVDVSLVDVVLVDVLGADVLGGMIGAACPVELGPQALNATAAMASPATALRRVLTVIPFVSPGGAVCPGGDVCPGGARRPPVADARSLRGRRCQRRGCPVRPTVTRP